MTLKKISDKGLNLIKQFEGFKNHIYKCPAGIDSIGYGHAINPKQYGLIKSMSPISQETAETFLKKDVAIAEKIINSQVKVDLTQNQFDALVSLVYNWGEFNFKASDGLKKLNNSDFKGASIEFFDPIKGVVRVKGNIISGLVARRLAELDLWDDKT